MKFDALKNLMDHFVESDQAPGNCIEVYLDGKSVFKYSCGVADLKTGKPMTGDEYFNLYSCSKITTVTAALQLFEQGKFLLTDPLYDYIPEYKTMYIKTPDGDLIKAKNDIKVQNLFNMTAGLTYNTKSQGFAKARELTAGKMNTVTVAKCIAEDPLSFEPGTRFQYSLCHDVLAAFVEVVSGKKFRDYVKENIFEPLGMDKAVYHYTPEIIEKLACQYNFVPEGSTGNIDMVEAQKYGRAKNGTFVDVGVKNSHIHGEEYDSGGAGIITTAGDYAKLATALANYGLGLSGERILAKSTVELMRTNTLSEEQRATFNWRQLAGYGYGLGVRTMIDKAAGGSSGNLGEFGWGGAAGASVYIDPSINMAAVYAKHTLNPREEYYQPRVRNVIYTCLNS